MFRRCFFASLLAWGGVLASAFGAEPFRVGAAAVDITPPAEMPFQVPQTRRGPVPAAEGVHDPLHAKAVVFASGGVKAAIVACDLTSIPLAIITAAREEVGRVCSVPPENVMITATHTHTVPNIRPRFFKATASPEQWKIAEAYLERLPQLMAESVRQAEARLAPARLQGALGQVEDVAYNRRILMRDRRVYSNPGKEHPEELRNVVRPSGPTDTSLPLLYLETAEGHPLASMINFAMHLDTMGGLRYSADFPAVIARILAEVKGPDMLTHFTIGAAGNINHYQLLDPVRPHRVKGSQETARIGTLLAAEVVRSYAKLQPLTTAPLKVSREQVRLKMHAEKSAQFAAQHNRQPFFDGEVMETFVDGQYTFEAEVMVITLGDETALIGVPGELFVELGMQVKLNSPYRYTFVNGLANGSIGYIPNRKAHSEGAYGASVLSTRCDPGSGEALVESAIRQLIAHRDIEPTLR